MITKKQYVEYLLSTPKNCTCTSLAEHLDGVSHDVVTDMLHQKRFMPSAVWKLVKEWSDVRWQVEEVHRGLKSDQEESATA